VASLPSFGLSRREQAEKPRLSILHQEGEVELVFVLRDDWFRGSDSRYFGPLNKSAIEGRVLGVFKGVIALVDLKIDF
jgi:type IV secretory pathway protease TraF